MYLVKDLFRKERVVVFLGFQLMQLKTKHNVNVPCPTCQLAAKSIARLLVILLISRLNIGVKLREGVFIYLHILDICWNETGY